MQLSALMVYFYLGNTSVRSPLFRSAWQDPSSARLCRVLSLARQPEGKQQQRLLSRRAGEKKESRLPPLSGRSSKALSTAVRTTQGDLPDSISLTLFSVPKPNSWHVKTLLPMPASVQVFQPRNLFCADSKTHAKLSLAVSSAQNDLSFPLPVFTVTLWCLNYMYVYFLHSGCLSEVPCHPLKAEHYPGTT